MFEFASCFFNTFLLHFAFDHKFMTCYNTYIDTKGNT
jgi:hypothetical protein